MSDLSLKVNRSLFAKSNVPALIGSGKLTKIYKSKAPNNAALPYGLISRIAPGTVMYNFGGTIAKEDDLWLLKVVADSPSAGKSAEAFAEEMVNLWEATIGAALTLTGGGRVTWCEKFSDMVPLDEPRGDGWIYHRGMLLRIVSEPS